MSDKREADGEVTTIEEMKAMVKQYGGKLSILLILQQTTK